MRTLYLDCFAGISGNMILGALMDLGLDYEQWLAEIQKLEIPAAFKFCKETRKNYGITGTFFDVELTGDGEHEHMHEHEHEHADGTVHCHMHSHMFSHDHIHLHEHEHEHEHLREHEHEHEHEHLHLHEHEHSHSHRHYGEIVATIDKLSLPEKVKADSKAVFTTLAHAEGAVHSMPWQEAGFHEVGNWDSVIDIVGGCLALHMMKIDKIVAGNLADGSGTIECAHGIMPVPVPAVAKMLEGSSFLVRTVPDVYTELITPTGMAMLKTLTTYVNTRPIGRLIRVGYGFGSRETGRLNALRGMLIETEAGPLTGDSISCEGELADQVAELSFTVDDADAETLAYLQEKLRRNGALDVVAWGVTAKKQRTALRIEVIIPTTEIERFTKMIFCEQGTVGLRYRILNRRKMARSFSEITVHGCPIKIKEFTYHDIHKCTVEYEDLAALADKLNLSLREARELVLRQRGQQNG